MGFNVFAKYPTDDAWVLIEGGIGKKSMAINEASDVARKDKVPVRVVMDREIRVSGNNGVHRVVELVYEFK